MSIAFFIVGFCIFGLYVYFLIWSIFYHNKRQREEGNGIQGYYERHQPDDIDMDGMGNQGRFNSSLRQKTPKRKKGSQSRQKNYSWHNENQL